MTTFAARAPAAPELAAGGLVRIWWRAWLPLLRAALRVPSVRRAAGQRAARVPLLLSAHALGAFGVALLAPSLSLVLAPLLLGVPHAVADVRHLVARRRLPRWWLRSVGAFALALVALRVLEETRVFAAAPLRLEHGLGSAWLALGALGGAVLGGWRRSAWVALLLSGAVVTAALVEPPAFRAVFVHAHNLVALAIWLVLFRRGGTRLALALVPVGVVLVGAGLLGSGALLGVTVHHGALSVAGLHLFVAADWLAPGLPDAPAIALTTAFAFLQSVHYGIWLVAIPRDDRTARRPAGAAVVRGAAGAWRNLARDLSPAGATLAVALGLLVLGAGALAPARTRTLFLSLATFHAWMELALLAFFVARDGLGRGVAPAGAPPMSQDTVPTRVAA